MSTIARDGVVALDVRPVLARGEEPFTMIMEAAGRVPVGGVLELTAPFEPVPLYAVLSGRGFGHVTTPLAGGGAGGGGGSAFLVRFVQTGITAAATVQAVHERHPATAGVFAAREIDLCCGGGKTLAFVAQAHGIELRALLAALQQAVVREG